MVEGMENQETTSEAAAETKKAGLAINGKTIAIGLGAFVIFLVIFSIVMGIFSSPEQPQVAEATEEEDVAGKDTIEDVTAKYASPWHSEYNDDYVERVTDDSTAGGLSVEDSVSHVKWYEEQKAEIERERVKLRAEAAELTQLKMETEALLAERKKLEQTNITNLAKLFDSMKSKEVAAIIENLPDAKVGLILQKMKKQNASEVMAELPSERAATITMQLMDLDGEY